MKAGHHEGHSLAPKPAHPPVVKALSSPGSKLAPTHQAAESSAPVFPSNTPAGIAVRLADEVDAVWRAVLSSLVPAGAQALWQALLDGPVALRAIECGRLPRPVAAVDLGSAEGTNDADFAITDAFVLLARLWASQAVVLASASTEAALEIRAGAPDEPLDIGVGPLAGRFWRISRFASLRGELGPDGAPGIVVEYPAGTVLTRIASGHTGRVATFFASLLVPRALAADSADINGGGDAELLFLLAVAGIAGPADTEGKLAEDHDPILRQWEHHDLLMHFRSRQGRHQHEMGAGFRFKGVLDAQPALKPHPWRNRAIALPRLDLRAAAAIDPPFTAVLEMRRSIRAHDSTRPIDLARIGHFLYRSARVRSCYATEIGEFTSRPHPSGGASHEMEIYLTVDHALDLARGFYYYDPAAHTLCFVRDPDANMEALLHDAWTSSAGMCRPQVLITLASRFQRVSWKYSGMAYAAQLKNVGVLYQTFYLVATAMNLAGCALGLGNAQRFTRLAGTDYLRESSVGEFMLGTPAG